MKELHTIIKPLIYFAIIIFTSSCGNEDIIIPCLPMSLTSFGEEIRYQYDAQGKLISISYFSQGGSFAKRVISISYTDERLSGATDKSINTDGTEILLNQYSLEYVGDKPSKLLVGVDPDSRAKTEFSYDAKGRLVLRTREFGSIISKTRYEYNDQNNVVNIFYTSPVTTEVLGAENISFDDKVRFYSDSKELEIFNVFVFGYEPSINNKLKSNISWVNPFIQNTPQRMETYTLEYNQAGLIITNSATAFASEFTFSGLKYTCD